MSRTVRISTAALLMTDDIRSREGALIDQAFEMVDEAAREKPDVICLPEDYDLLARPKERESSYKGEAIPGGPITTRMQEKAGEYGCYIINTILEAVEGGRPFNTAVVIGRDGSVVGKYRKTHLAPDEKAYAQAGSELPVFECDFGRIAIMVCMDIHYPEIARTYALKGAEIIFWPTMAADGDKIYQQLLAVRAYDNQLFCVSSDYLYIPPYYSKQTGEARIVDRMGIIRASTGRKPGVATALVDLDEIWEVYGQSEPSMKEQYLGWRRPELYRGICEKDDGGSWRKE